MSTNAGTISGTPAGTVPLPGETGLTAQSLLYRVDPPVPASNFLYAGTGSGGTTGGSSITNIIPPADLIAGDLLIMDVVAWNATVSGWPAGSPSRSPSPGGWTRLTSGSWPPRSLTAAR